MPPAAGDTRAQAWTDPAFKTLRACMWARVHRVVNMVCVAWVASTNEDVTRVDLCHMWYTGRGHWSLQGRIAPTSPTAPGLLSLPTVRADNARQKAAPLKSHTQHRYSGGPDLGRWQSARLRNACHRQLAIHEHKPGRIRLENASCVHVGTGAQGSHGSVCSPGCM
jgi:hypothetical protein